MFARKFIASTQQNRDPPSRLIPTSTQSWGPMPPDLTAMGEQQRGREQVAKWTTLGALACMVIVVLLGLSILLM